MSSTTSVSLSQARELYNVIVACEAKLDALDRKAKTTTVSFAELYNVVQDVFMILRQMNLPPAVEQTIMLVQRLIIAFNSLRLALNALTIATVTSPVGWVIAGLGFTATMLSAFAGLGTTMSKRQR